MYDSDGASFISSNQCKSPDVLVALTVAYEAPSLYYAELIDSWYATTSYVTILCTPIPRENVYANV